MSTRPCSVHGKRLPYGEKLASVYWRWQAETGVSVGYLQRLCPPCAIETIKPILVHVKDDSLDASVCPVCGSDSSNGMVPFNITICTPGSERRDLELPICSGCAPRAAAIAMLGADRLPDRGGSRGAMAPREPLDPFEDLWS